MKKRGFTIIELLAVIVVLAIIALIATPIVMNTIKNSKKGAAERGAENYIKQVEIAIATTKLEGKEVLDGTYQIDNEGNLTASGTYHINNEGWRVERLPEGKLVIEMNGEKPTLGKIKITNGIIDKLSSSMMIGDYYVNYNSSKSTYIASELYDGILCTSNTTKVPAILYNGDDPLNDLVFNHNESSYVSEEVGLLASESGAYTPGVTYTCELGDNEEKTFFVLEENGDKVSLIAGFNLGDTVAWVSEEDYVAAGGWGFDSFGLNNLGPITAQKTLSERTERWTKLDQLQISLPSAEQIANASGKIFDKTNNLSDLPTWLSSTTKIPVLYGYWTSTATDLYANAAWNVNYNGILNSYDDSGDNGAVGLDNFNGIRPVITVSKSQLN